jgi:ATP-dependent DNA helicase RecQ
MEIGLLRALWRAVGKRLESGATVDLDGLPPGFGGAPGAMPILGRLEERQFLVWERTGGGMRLVDPGKPLSAFQVDWGLLDRRRRADLAKLDAMQQYAYTKQCRRGFVLRYFGDPAAASKCEGCDNCLGTWQPADERAPVERKTRSRRTDSRRSAGGAWGGAESGGGAATETRGELALEGEDAELFAALRSLRGSIARDEKVPAYVVFPDRTLAEMAVRRPRSLGALADIRGVGPAKLEKYGERFLDAIRGG